MEIKECDFRIMRLIDNATKRNGKGYELGYGNLGQAVWPPVLPAGWRCQNNKQGLGMNASKRLRLLEKHCLVRVVFEGDFTYAKLGSDGPNFIKDMDKLGIQENTTISEETDER